MNETQAYKELTPEQRRDAKSGLQGLTECAKSWKLQESAPFTIDGRTFDMVKGSIELCDFLHRELRKCLLGQHPPARLEELDAMQGDHFAAVAELEEAFYGQLVQLERDGVQRAARDPDKGWRRGKSSPLKVQGTTFDAVTEELLHRVERRVLIIGEGDRSFALYHVLRRAILKGEKLASKEETLKRADALAVHLATNEGAWPREF